MNDMPRVVVGILAYKSEKYIRTCLKSVLDQTYPNIEIIVLNNHSPDTVDEIIESEFPEINLIKSEENLGFGKGHNKIWSSRPDDLYLCLNVDIILEPDFIAELVNTLKSHPKAGTVSGKIKRWDFQKNDKTDQIDTVGLEIHSNHKVIDIGAGETDTGQYDGLREVFGVSGAVFLIRPDAMKELGGFDERMFMYKEDVDLMYRMQWLGYKVFVNSKAVAYHDRTHGKGNVSRNVRGMSFVHHRIMLKKNLSNELPKSVILKTRFYEFLKGTYSFSTNFQFFSIWHHIKGDIQSSSKKADVKDIVKWFKR
jgi:GT2 family glycosyltransferase